MRLIENCPPNDLSHIALEPLRLTLYAVADELALAISGAETHVRQLVTSVTARCNI